MMRTMSAPVMSAVMMTSLDRSVSGVIIGGIRACRFAEMSADMAIIADSVPISIHISIMAHCIHTVPVKSAAIAESILIGVYEPAGGPAIIADSVLVVVGKMPVTRGRGNSGNYTHGKHQRHPQHTCHYSSHTSCFTP